MRPDDIEAMSNVQQGGGGQAQQTDSAALGRDA